MCSHGAILIKGFATFCTNIRFFTSVDAFVSFETLGKFKTLITHITHVGSVSGMYHHVNPQTMYGSQPNTTFRTFIWMSTFVFVDMDLELLCADETLATRRTFIRSVTTMNLHMTVVRGNVGKLLSARDTFIYSFTSMDPFMNKKFAGRSCTFSTN